MKLWRSKMLLVFLGRLSETEKVPLTSMWIKRLACAAQACRRLKTIHQKRWRNQAISLRSMIYYICKSKGKMMLILTIDRTLQRISKRKIKQRQVCSQTSSHRLAYLHYQRSLKITKRQVRRQLRQSKAMLWFRINLAYYSQAMEWFASSTKLIIRRSPNLYSLDYRLNLRSRWLWSRRWRWGNFNLMTSYLAEIPRKTSNYRQL